MDRSAPRDEDLDELEVAEISPADEAKLDELLAPAIETDEMKLDELLGDTTDPGELRMMEFDEPSAFGTRSRGGWSPRWCRREAYRQPTFATTLQPPLSTTEGW
jgi:hypothetical protein